MKDWNGGTLEDWNDGFNRKERMKLPGLKSRVSCWPPGFAGLPTLRSGHHSSPSLKTRGFLEDLIKNPFSPYSPLFHYSNGLSNEEDWFSNYR
jgi:hypothetical protein